MIVKVVNDTKTGNSLKAGCACSSGYTSTRGPWNPFMFCNCSCKNSYIYDGNSIKAKRS